MAEYIKHTMLTHENLPSHMPMRDEQHSTLRAATRTSLMRSL
jgi:hypothetical protein